MTKILTNGVVLQRIPDINYYFNNVTQSHFSRLYLKHIVH